MPLEREPETARAEDVMFELLEETLHSLRKPTDALSLLQVVPYKFTTAETLHEIKQLHAEIKNCIQEGKTLLAHEYLIDYIDTVAENRREVLASLMSTNIRSGQRDEQHEGYYRVGDVAKRLGVSTQTVKRHCEEGRFSGTKRTPGGHWRIPKAVFRTTEEQDQQADQTLRRLNQKYKDQHGDVDEFDLL